MKLLDPSFAGEENNVTQISPATSLAQQIPPGIAPAATPQKAQQPAAQPPPQESAEVKAKIAAIYAEAETDHWSASQTNQAVTKELEQSGSSSTTDAITLIDATA